jgi:hypothetical protein
LAKKKRKRRPPARPTPPQQEQGPARVERKEAARKEREMRIRRARRRVLLRRLVRLGALVLLVGVIAGFIYWRGGEGRRLREAAASAAERLACTEVQDPPDEGAGHLAPGDPPPAYGTKPAVSGRHDGSTLGTDIDVFEDPIDATLEPRALHSMEHAYVIMYYRQDGEAALPQNVVDSLADLARQENKVILAPYAEMPEGQSLALAAWRHLQTCPRVTDAGSVVDMAKGFISQFRGGGDAPEPQAV